MSYNPERLTLPAVRNSLHDSCTGYDSFDLSYEDLGQPKPNFVFSGSLRPPLALILPAVKNSKHDSTLTMILLVCRTRS